MGRCPAVSERDDKKEKTFIIICALCVVISAVLGICFGSVGISASEILRAIFFEGESVNANIIMFARVPRVAASLLAGCALAVSGVIIQAVLENPLAAPSIIGVNSGAGFFAVLAMALFPGKMSAVPAACSQQGPPQSRQTLWGEEPQRSE